MKKTILSLIILFGAVVSMNAQQNAAVAGSKTASPPIAVTAHADAVATETKTETTKACCAGKTAAECKHDAKACTKTEAKACCADKKTAQCSHDAPASGKTEAKACCASADKKACSHDKVEEKKKD